LTDPGHVAEALPLGRVRHHQVLAVVLLHILVVLVSLVVRVLLIIRRGFLRVELLQDKIQLHNEAVGARLNLAFDDGLDTHGLRHHNIPQKVV